MLCGNYTISATPWTLFRISFYLRKEGKKDIHRMSFLVEVTGLEPATSTSLTWRSSQTEPHLVTYLLKLTPSFLCTAELLTRFELVTSSLPRMRSTDWAIVANMSLREVRRLYYHSPISNASTNFTIFSENSCLHSKDESFGESQQDRTLWKSGRSLCRL